MRTVPIRAAESVDAAFVRDVTEAFVNCSTLGEVLRWASQQSPRVQVADIVTQDEYTHDVVLPFGSVFLSFDTTWLGAITAVAVWQHQPSANELLGDRLALGWKPTASRLKVGDRVLGHAACAVTGEQPAGWIVFQVDHR